MSRPPSPGSPRGSHRSAAPRAVQSAYPVARAVAPGAARPALPPLPCRPPLISVLLYRVLRWIIVGLIGGVIFIVGMEVGYRRADERWRQLAAEREPLQAKAETTERDRKRDEAKPQPPPAPQPPSAILPKEKSAPARAAAAISFDAHILPIFKAKCTSCHGDFKKRAGLDLRTAAAVFKGGESGPGLRPGNAQASSLWEYVADDRMPPGKDKLSAAEKTLLRRWIDGGAK